MVAFRKIAWCRRLCLKYKLFILVGIVLLSVQLFIATSLYKLNILDWQDNDHQWENSNKKSFGEIFESDQSSWINKQKVIQRQKVAEEEQEDLNFLLSSPDDTEDESVQKPHSAIKHLASYKKGAKFLKKENRKHQLDSQKKYGLSLIGDEKILAVNVSLILQTAKCDLTEDDLISALERAKTYKCQKQIVDVGCQIKTGTFYRVQLPRYCHLKDPNGGKYLGCFKDDRTTRDLSGQHISGNNNSPYLCINFCLRAGYKYCSLQFGKECWCGDKYGRYGELPKSACDNQCTGDSTQHCGGYLAADVYNTGFGEKVVNEVSRVEAGPLHSPYTSRVAFVLTVNGRAVRQVLRLFKAIYHVNHYYYIHVDSRQEFMHRELSKLQAKFPNVRLSKWRGSTIWGGASLLQMLLRCMEDLLAMKDWRWDYFINLSESDFPVKTVEELTTWLTKYKGKNFLRSSGSNTPRFLRKQGMDKTFVECDTHMWRIGQRPLPEGIRMDGGSDWIGLNRQFCQYVVTSSDPLVTGLKNYYQYTLLPAESFFHTVIHNSKFCATWVDNNMHLTNWKRKQGCQCQYKHIVDWCGCSPNDFKMEDFPRLQQTSSKPTFFARKFEAVISNSIVYMLEEWLYDDYPSGTVALDHYWQNDFHHNDINTGTKDEYLTGYFSFARQSLQKFYETSNKETCQLKVHKMLEANLYFDTDTFKGMLINFEAKISDQSDTYKFESLLKREDYRQTVLTTGGPASRLKSIQVSTDYDPKELMFRNFAGLKGPNSDLVLKHSWGGGDKLTVDVVWIDPQNIIAGVYEENVEAGEWVGNHKPHFIKPLQPGIWTVIILYSQEPVVQTQFLIIPLSHVDKKTVSREEAIHFHTPPKKMYTTQDVTEYISIIHLEKYSRKRRDEDNANAKLVGKDLHKWIDTLLSQYWTPQAVCVEGNKPKGCWDVPACHQTTWSSKSPDPKSEIGNINASTGRIR